MLGEDVQKFEPLCNTCDNIKWYSSYGKQYGRSSKKLTVELPYDPAIPILDIHPKELKAET